MEKYDNLLLKQTSPQDSYKKKATGRSSGRLEVWREFAKHLA